MDFYLKTMKKDDSERDSSFIQKKYKNKLV